MKLKTKKAEMQLEGEFNNMPGREKVEELLLHYLGQRGISEYKVVDVPEKKFWDNDNDTLVIEIDPNETWRFGEKAVGQFAINLANLVRELNCDEFHTEKNGSKFIIRFWWD